MKYPRKLIIVSLGIACLLSAPKAQTASPRLPGPMSWAGTKELAAGNPEAALQAVQKDVTSAAVADTLLRHFKLGVINARLLNHNAAAASFNTVIRSCPVLAPFAWEQLGDVEAAQNSNAKAQAAYAAALGTPDLPLNYRQHVFAKIRRIAGKGVPLSSAVVAANPPWLDEYRKWDRRQRLFNAAALEAACDSLLNAGLTAAADSLLEQHLPGLSRRDVCGIVDRMFGKRSSDPVTTTKFLFSLATQANGCRNFAAAERMLAAAQKRPDFATAVPAKSALLLAAQIAYGNAQWQKAIDLYTNYNTAHGPDSDVIMNIARACRSLGNADKAHYWYDLHVKSFPTHAQSQEILWLRAWNTEERREYRAAAAAYGRVFNTKGKRTEEAHLRHALCYYRLGDFDSTVLHLAAFQKKYPQSNYLWAGMFWQGKSLAAAGKTEEAHRVWASLAKLDPLDYYAHRARQLMGVDTSKFLVTSPFAAQTTEAQVRAWLENISPASSKKSLTPADSAALRRGGVLLAAALPETADFFLDEFEKNYSANLLLQFEIASGYAIAGNPARSFRVARRLAWRIPTGHRDRMPLQVLSILYPPFYSPVITPNAERFGVDPLFVSSVMRQESIFDDKIVSPAGAVGLMQVMPATGREIAKELKEPYDTDSLYNYAYNIRFGTFYLRKRLTMFRGDHVLALCSYNAGPGNATKWRDRNKGLEYDLFAEDIGFFETRGYVKKVMGNYWTYRILAETPGYDYELPLIRDEYPWVNEW